MRCPRAAPLLLCLVAACSQPAERGRPETLHPILGRGLGAGPPRTKPGEPVEDYVVDLGALVPAWPSVADELPGLLRAVIARGSWVDEHHTALALDGVLRVRHRPDVVAQSRRLVESLRARLLSPLQIQVAFVDAGADAAGRLFLVDRGRGRSRWDARAFRAAVGQGKARTLARVALTAHNGQWALADRVSNQVYLSGVGVAEGIITPRTTTLASGFTVQAAAWRWGEERAVVALTGLYTGQARGGQKVTQKVHRLLPSQKTYERQWEPHDVELELPVREMIEIQNQLTVTRGEWTVAAVLPRDGERVSAVVVRVDWRAPVPDVARVKTLSPGGHVLEVIPIALPIDTRPGAGLDVDNRRTIDKNAVEWFRSRARVYQEAQKKSTFNFQAETGNVDLNLTSQRSWMYGKLLSKSGARSQFQSRGSGSGGGAGALPEALEKLRVEVMQAEWPDGTALEFLANHVFVVHRAGLCAKLRTLLEKTHEWRNGRVFVQVAFPVLDAATADDLEGATLPRRRAEALARGRTLLPGAFVLGRGGAWGELFVGEMHAVLSQAWAPDRSSPDVHVYWRGARLGAAPHLDARGLQHLELRWKQHRLEGSAPRTVAGAILQQPTDAEWAHEQPLQVSAGQAVLTGLQGEGGQLPALLVRAALR